MATTSSWTWDPVRQDYYLWSPSENAFVYHSTTTPTSAHTTDAGYTARIDLPQSHSIPDARDSPGSNHSDDEYSALSHQVQSLSLNEGFKSLLNYNGLAAYPHQVESHSAIDSTRANGQPQAERNYQQSFQFPIAESSQYPTSAIPTYGYSGQLQTQSASYQQGYSSAHSAQYPIDTASVSTAYGADTSQSHTCAFEEADDPLQPLQTGPPAEITDEKLFKKGIVAQGRIRTTYHATADPAYKDYKKRRSDFFKVGKVFQVHWPVEYTTYEQYEAVAAEHGSFAEQFEQYCVFRRQFVVVEQNGRSISCIPISTYGGYGCAKTVVRKEYHAVIYAGRRKPGSKPEKLPQLYELKMLRSIRVVPHSKRDKLNPMARVNFSEIYSVESGIRAYDFGDVHKDYKRRLLANWKIALAQLSAEEEEADALQDRRDYQDGLDDDENSDAEDQDRFGH